jgi:excisionase family DNA binding protein
MKIFNITEAAQYLNLSVKTLQRLDRNKILIASRTGTNRRVYTQEQLDLFLFAKDNRKKTV